MNRGEFTKRGRTPVAKRIGEATMPPMSPAMAPQESERSVWMPGPSNWRLSGSDSTKRRSQSLSKVA